MSYLYILLIFSKFSVKKKSAEFSWVRLPGKNTLESVGRKAIFVYLGIATVILFEMQKMLICQAGSI